MPAVHETARPSDINHPSRSIAHTRLSLPGSGGGMPMVVHLQPIIVARSAGTRRNSNSLAAMATCRPRERERWMDGVRRISGTRGRRLRDTQHRFPRRSTGSLVRGSASSRDSTSVDRNESRLRRLWAGLFGDDRSLSAERELGASGNEHRGPPGTVVSAIRHVDQSGSTCIASAGKLWAASLRRGVLDAGARSWGS